MKKKNKKRQCKFLQWDYLWKFFCNLGSSFFSTFAAIGIAIAANVLTILCFDNEDISPWWFLLVGSWFTMSFLAFKISKILKSSESNFLKIDTITKIHQWVFNNTKESRNHCINFLFFAMFVLTIILMMLYWVLARYA